MGLENVPGSPAWTWPRETMPAGCGVDCCGLPGAKAAPAVARLSLCTIVLWTIRTFTASWIAIPPPANAASLFAMTLLYSSTR